MKAKKYRELTQKHKKTLEDRVTIAYYHPDGGGII